jgi:hypothetical protein
MDTEESPPGRATGKGWHLSRHRRSKRSANAAQPIDDRTSFRKHAAPLASINQALDPAYWESIRWQASSENEVEP